jgi:hypothetical protein
LASMPEDYSIEKLEEYVRTAKAGATGPALSLSKTGVNLERSAAISPARSLRSAVESKRYSESLATFDANRSASGDIQKPEFRPSRSFLDSSSLWGAEKARPTPGAMGSSGWYLGSNQPSIRAEDVGSSGTNGSTRDGVGP